MGTSDGSVVGATKIVDNGSDADRWNLVLVAEGYRSTEAAQFATHAQSFVNTLFTTAPFDTLQAAINVHRLDVESTDSGADDPTPCGGSGAAPATYFDASFCGSGIRRLLLVDQTSVIAAVDAEVPEWDAILVLVNTTIYGGAGGAIGTFSMAAGANEIGLHEMGHTAFGLADEYEYWAGCGVDTNRDNHPAGEPAQPNVTLNTNRATLKWGDLVAATTPVPTTNNADCTACDPQPNPLPAATVGVYEGAHYYHCDAYRPQFDCRMRALSNPFCAVCRRVIVQALTPHLPTKTIIKEFKEGKLEKFEKLEKNEKTEKPEFKEAKGEAKLEKPEWKEGKLEKPELKELKLEIREGKDPRPELEIFKPVSDLEPWRPDFAERFELVEQRLEQLSHFIDIDKRPDLSRGALREETSTRKRPGQTKTSATGTKRAKRPSDTPRRPRGG